MSKDELIYINDIKDCIEIILTYTKGKNENDFLGDLMLQDAVIRRFEIIGEAASKLSAQFIATHPSVPWRLMKAMRNKLIHEYSGVSPSTIYSTVVKDPLLQEQLNKLGSK